MYLNRNDSAATSTLHSEPQRLAALRTLDITGAENSPIFEEAVQTAAHFTDTSIGILSLAEANRQRFKAAVGLGCFGLMNELSRSRQLPRDEPLTTTVLHTQQYLVIDNIAEHPQYHESVLVHQYKIQSYLGVPLFNADGWCLGTLAVMNLQPHRFTRKDIRFLELVSRWSMSEIERNTMLDPSLAGERRSPRRSTASPSARSAPPSGTPTPATLVKTALIRQVVQELQPPLTSIMGMASVLNREIYGPLTDKQKEYLDIIHNSSQSMMAVVQETIELGELSTLDPALDLTDVDLELFCQQSCQALRDMAQRHHQSLKITVEPGQRRWVLDKAKTKQILHHLIVRVIHASSSGSLVRVHVSHRSDQLRLAVWTSHPWLGDGLPHSEWSSLNSSDRINEPPRANADPSHSATGDRSSTNGAISPSKTSVSLALAPTPPSCLEAASCAPEGSAPAHPAIEKDPGAIAHAPDYTPDQTLGHPSASPDKAPDRDRHHLALPFCQTLARMHEGTLTLHGTPDTGYRYVLSLPKLVLNHPSPPNMGNNGDRRWGLAGG